ncbi:hypothetical protein [Labilibacter marinus]|uniref:hypothetical protein n=1 Tax=Labilibacter marinus TaxID=1477105 RepID=UPI00094FA49A|nr:hypothetical protein [Labilibacter marinus]
MRILVVLILTVGISVSTFSQKSVVIKGKTKYDLDYYFDKNKDSKMTMNKVNGFYELTIPKKKKYETVTLMENGDDMCDQKINISKLFEYAKITKTDTIINDATYISSCLRMDMMAPPEYENFVGKWENVDFEMYIYTDGEFYLKYKEESVSFQREGSSKITGANLILLKTRSIKNNLTGTYADDTETIEFVFKDGFLYSEKLDVRLKQE